MLDVRIIVDEPYMAIDILDENGVKNDLDEYDRIMISEKDLDEVIELLEEHDILDYEIIYY